MASSGNGMLVTRSIVQGYVELTDVLVGIGIVGLLITIAVADYRHAIAHAELIEVSFLLPGSRVDVHEYRATHGAWPGRGGVAPHFATRDENESGTRSIQVGADAALHFTIASKTTGDVGTLSYRAAVVPGNASSSIVWTCGYAAVPEGFIAAGANETTFTSDLLPSACRRRPASPASL